MASLFKKIKQRGLIFTFAGLFNRFVPERLFRMRYYYVLRLNPVRKLDDQRCDDVTVKMAETESEYSAIEELTYFRRHDSSGQKTACSATHNGQTVGGFWGAQGEFDENELGVQVKLAPNQCWLFAALVSESSRGKGIYPRILAAMSKHMFDQGATDQLVAVNPFNRASMRVHTRFAQPGQVAKILAIRFLKWTFCIKHGGVSQNKWLALNCHHSPVELNFKAPQSSPKAKHVSCNELILR